jgi:hypothetical protein
VAGAVGGFPRSIVGGRLRPYAAFRPGAGRLYVPRGAGNCATSHEPPAPAHGDSAPGETAHAPTGVIDTHPPAGEPHAPAMPLSLTVLGTASPHPEPDRPCSGYLLRGGGAEVWVDVGFGTFAELRRHTDPARLTAIWISHRHADHCADLSAAVHAYAYGGVTPAGPIPDVDFLEGVLGFRTLHDGHRRSAGGAYWRTRGQRAVRRAGGAGAGSRCFLCEADIDAPCEGERQVHLTPEDAGACARGAGESRMV